MPALTWITNLGMGGGTSATATESYRDISLAVHDLQLLSSAVSDIGELDSKVNDIDTVTVET